VLSYASLNDLFSGGGRGGIGVHGSGVVPRWFGAELKCGTLGGGKGDVAAKEDSSLACEEDGEVGLIVGAFAYAPDACDEGDRLCEVMKGHVGLRA